MSQLSHGQLLIGEGPGLFGLLNDGAVKQTLEHVLQSARRWRCLQ